MQINLNLHTLILLVGPSNAGKSYFSKNVLIPQLSSQLSEAGIEPNIQYLSSDDLRRTVLGRPEAHKYDGNMMHVSKKAFNMLHTYIDNLTEFPNPAHYVIVDTTGLSKVFRDQILEQTRNHNYNTACIVFDYKSVDEHFKHEEGSKFVTRKHVERMRKYFWKDFNRRQFDYSCKIQKQDFSGIEVSVNNLEKYQSCIISDDPVYDVIGDVHGCYDELMDLLKRLGYKLENGKITGHHKDEERRLIFVGDLVDKGPKTKEVLQFVLNNQEYCLVVKGNHENFTAKWHKGLLNHVSMEESFRKEHFADTFTTDEEMIDLIKQIDDISLPFLEATNFIVTHAPCMNKDLGKLNKAAVRGQLKGKSGSEKLINAPAEEAKEFYSYLKEDADRSYPYHIFGHKASKSPILEGNKIGLDTGCVHGGRLTAVTVVGTKTFLTSVPARETYQDKPLIDIFNKDEDKYKFNLDGLTGRERGRIKWSAEDKINFISGTMSPSPASETEIEPLSTALDYYFNAGVENVVLQPKYMGSRCNVYLYRDIDKCYAVSRKGFNINEKRVPEIKKIFKPLQSLFDKFPNAEMLLLDGELLPWEAMGKGLIEEDFGTVAKAVGSELSILKKTGFDEKIAEIYECEDFKNYKYDQVKVNKKELGEKYGQHNVSTYKNVMNFTHRPVEEHLRHLAIFNRQLELFGGSGDLEYKPFDVLKVVNKDGSEEVITGTDNSQIFGDVLGNTTYEVIHKGNVEDAYSFFKHICSDKEMEGVVVKPLTHVDGVAPFMKVRNENYLTITYGYDYKFPEKYERLLKSKNIKRKLNTSIKEYELGKNMLEIPQTEITKDNELYQGLVANIIFEEKKEEFFDPRL